MANISMVTGYTGEPHVTSAEQGAVNAAVFGQGKYVLDVGDKLSATVKDNTTITINDGYVMDQGRQMGIASGDVVNVKIPLGTSGYKRNDIIVVRYNRDLSTGIESAELTVKVGVSTTGNPTDATVVSGDILSGDSVDEMALYRVKVEGTSIIEVEPMFQIINSVPEYALQNVAEFESEMDTKYNSFTSSSETKYNEFKNSLEDSVNNKIELYKEQTKNFDEYSDSISLDAISRRDAYIDVGTSVTGTAPNENLPAYIKDYTSIGVGDVDVRYQEWTDLVTGNKYKRLWTNDTWSPWKPVSQVIQSGTVTMPSTSAGKYTTKVVTFAAGVFSSTPRVVATISTTSTSTAYATTELVITGASPTSVTLKFYNGASQTSFTPSVHWIAIGE